MMAKQTKQKKGSKAGITVAIWILALLIIFLLFVINKNKIRDALNETGFFSFIGVKETPAWAAPAPKDAPTITDNSVTITVTDAPPAQPAQTPVTPQPTPQTPQNPAQSTPPAAKPTAPVTTVPVTIAPPVQTQQLRIWFVAVEGDGAISRKEMIRPVSATDTPLTAAIQSLLAGPTAAERDKGCTTFIPSGTRLLSASIKNGVATLNFSEEFQFNPYGVEGYEGELMQVVYTATAFPTVDSVQFLVESEQSEYIGSEGVWIGSPLSRASFR
jgi:spore germination protein GerM